MSLKQYKKEWATFTDTQKRIITDKKKIEKIAKTLSTRFNIYKPYISYSKKKEIMTGSAYRTGNKIILGEKGTTLHVLAHELAHSLTKQRFNKTGHNKLHYKWVTRICNHIRKRNYFNIKEGPKEHIEYIDELSNKYIELKDPKFTLNSSKLS